jgi:hypothetical protein
MQRSDDVSDRCQIDFTGLGRTLYGSFLRLHKEQTITFPQLRKLGA